MESEKISFKKWDSSAPPERILVIRLHAIGDTALVLPGCNSLRKLYPSSRIDILTGELSAPLVSASGIFDNVYAFKDYSAFKRPSISVKLDKIKESKKWGAALKQNNYDVLIDAQSNRVSRLMRYFTGIKYYAEFDRLGSRAASERTLDTFRVAGFEQVVNDCSLEIDALKLSAAKKILFNNSWDGRSKLIVLNPGGLWKTRNWPIENYVNLAKLMLRDENYLFVIIGDKRIEDKAERLKEHLGNSMINLAGKTTLEEALAIFQFVDFTVTEDSALIHISWASGVPTLALLGSTRNDWTSPAPPHGTSLNSSDLECGNCMAEICKFGDVHCLTRFTPEIVYEKIKELIKPHPHAS